jgi:hypothetical protein
MAEQYDEVDLLDGQVREKVTLLKGPIHRLLWAEFT